MQEPATTAHAQGINEKMKKKMKKKTHTATEKSWCETTFDGIWGAIYRAKGAAGLAVLAGWGGVVCLS